MQTMDPYFVLAIHGLRVHVRLIFIFTVRVCACACVRAILFRSHLISVRLPVLDQ